MELHTLEGASGNRNSAGRADFVAEAVNFVMIKAHKVSENRLLERKRSVETQSSFSGDCSTT
jgi:hypothetical protein